MTRKLEITKSGSFPICSPTLGFHRVINIHSEQDLQRQVSLTKSQLRDLRMSNDSNQAKLLDHSSRQGEQRVRPYMGSCIALILFIVDQEVVSKLAEVDMIVADLERANSRVATVERRNVRIAVALLVSFNR